jgi:hypothetical protein
MDTIPRSLRYFTAKWQIIARCWSWSYFEEEEEEAIEIQTERIVKGKESEKGIGRD